MHQYPLSTEKDEREDEHVVSNVFYQSQERTENNDDTPVLEIVKTDKNIVHDVILVGSHASILHA